MAKIEVSKENSDKVFEAIEVAKATGKIRKGANEVTKAIEKGTAKFAVIAKDVSPPEITMHIPMIGDEKGILVLEVASKEELGAAAGLGVGTAAVAVVNEGEGKTILKEIMTKFKQSE